MGNENDITQLMIHKTTHTINLNNAWLENADLFYEAQQQLNEYFEGRRQIFDLKLNPTGTPYQKKVWQTLAQIPYGQLFSDKDVAIRLSTPNTSRAVGLANSRNPIPITSPAIV